MVDEKSLEQDRVIDTITKEKKVHVKNKWLAYSFGPEPLQLEKYEVDPVTDIPIRLAVEKGVIPRKRDLSLYRTTEEWNGHARHSIVIAGPLEEGQPFAVWIGDDSYTPPKPGTELAIPKKIHEKPEIDALALPYAKPKSTVVLLIKRLESIPRRLFDFSKISISNPMKRSSVPAGLFKKSSPDLKSRSETQTRMKTFLSTLRSSKSKPTKSKPTKRG